MKKEALKNYRIVKRSYRDHETMEIRSRWYVERFEQDSFLGFTLSRWAWKPVMREWCTPDGSGWERAVFYSEKEAVDFLTNVLKPVPADEVIEIV